MPRNPAINFRPLGEAHLGEILAVYHQCQDFLALGPQPYASLAMVQQDLEHSRQEGGCFCGIFEVGDQMVGVMDYLPAGFQRDPRRAFVSLLMVAAPYRRRGIGGRALQQLESELHLDGQITWIYTAVQVNNPQALKFWVANGYQVVNGPTLQADTTVTYLLKKELKE